ncbi:hypothetical protein [Pseudomonas fragi]|uniref:hypothetical protein n=1 Tax=Pseudomonas fragi TaxID=296 RepID=UPI00117A2335|nr:hypothetical protein [Pseudomonas fragi]
MKLNIENFKVQPVTSKSRRELKTSQTGARLTSPKKTVGANVGVNFRHEKAQPSQIGLSH